MFQCLRFVILIILLQSTYAWGMGASEENGSIKVGAYVRKKNMSVDADPFAEELMLRVRSEQTIRRAVEAQYEEAMKLAGLCLQIARTKDQQLMKLRQQMGLVLPQAIGPQLYSPSPEGPAQGGIPSPLQQHKVVATPEAARSGLQSSPPRDPVRAGIPSSLQPRTGLVVSQEAQLQPQPLFPLGAARTGAQQPLVRGTSRAVKSGSQPPFPQNSRVEATIPSSFQQPARSLVPQGVGSGSQPPPPPPPHGSAARMDMPSPGRLAIPHPVESVGLQPPPFQGSAAIRENSQHPPAGGAPQATGSPSQSPPPQGPVVRMGIPLSQSHERLAVPRADRPGFQPPPQGSAAIRTNLHFSSQHPTAVGVSQATGALPQSPPLQGSAVVQLETPNSLQYPTAVGASQALGSQPQSLPPQRPMDIAPSLQQYMGTAPSAVRPGARSPSPHFASATDAAPSSPFSASGGSSGVSSDFDDASSVSSLGVYVGMSEPQRSPYAPSVDGVQSVPRAKNRSRPPLRTDSLPHSSQSLSFAQHLEASMKPFTRAHFLPPTPQTPQVPQHKDAVRWVVLGEGSPAAAQTHYDNALQAGENIHVDAAWSAAEKAAKAARTFLSGRETKPERDQAILGARLAAKAKLKQHTAAKASQKADAAEKARKRAAAAAKAAQYGRLDLTLTRSSPPLPIPPERPNRQDEERRQKGLAQRALISRCGEEILNRNRDVIYGTENHL
jgi:hypothetical protein